MRSTCETRYGWKRGRADPIRETFTHSTDAGSAIRNTLRETGLRLTSARQKAFLCHVVRVLRTMDA
eukprot:275716-Pyramimonas_sp.AAC.1